MHGELFIKKEWGEHGMGRTFLKMFSPFFSKKAPFF
jgi:hypothetical protein